MALIACPECEAQISEKASACPQCGYATVPSELIVSVASQWFIGDPRIRVELDGAEVGRLRRGDRVRVPVLADGVARFSSGVRSAQVDVRAGESTRLELGWDRGTGRLVARAEA